MLTTRQAAAELGVTLWRVQQLIREGLLPGAEKLGRDWMIPETALETARKRKVTPGRAKTINPAVNPPQ